jgi:hypothetical protein
MSGARRTCDNQASILVRVLCDAEGCFPVEVARSIAGVGFGDRDKARMRDLAVRN